MEKIGSITPDLSEHNIKLQKFITQFGLPLDIFGLDTAMTHESYHSIAPNKQSNEILEIIGDAVLDLVTLDWLQKEHPAGTEGQYTQLRSEIVENEMLGNVGKALGLEDLILSGDGARINEKQIGDSLEAIFGAIFKQSGYEACYRVFQRFFDEQLANLRTRNFIPDIEGKNQLNPKNRLLEILQKRNLTNALNIKLLRREGPPHSPQFFTQFTLTAFGQKIQVIGTGTTRKGSEKTAAQLMLDQLSNLIPVE